MRVLIVEDETDLADAVVRRLSREGHAVDWITDGLEADSVLNYQNYQLIILDIGIPGLDGFSLLRSLRRRGNRTPVLMLTARSDIEDRVSALDVGADDYLAKPFDFRELEARCRALTRRPPELAPNVTVLGRLTVDRNAMSASLDEIKVHLPNREYRLLEILLANTGRVLSKEQIAAQLFDFDDETGDNAIELYIGRLRRKLGEALDIRTIRGMGYVVERAAAHAG